MTGEAVPGLTIGRREADLSNDTWLTDGTAAVPVRLGTVLSVVHAGCRARTGRVHDARPRSRAAGRSFTTDIRGRHHEPEQPSGCRRGCEKGAGARSRRNQFQARIGSDRQKVRQPGGDSAVGPVLGRLRCAVPLKAGLGRRAPRGPDRFRRGSVCTSSRGQHGAEARDERPPSSGICQSPRAHPPNRLSGFDRCPPVPTRGCPSTAHS